MMYVLRTVFDWVTDCASNLVYPLLMLIREEVARHRQIFDSKAAYQMLSNELLGILR